MNRTNRCYDSAFWGAHAYRVLVKAFCLHELPLLLWLQPRKRKVRCRKMRQPARYKRALPRPVDTSSLIQMNSEPNIASSGVTDPGYRPATTAAVLLVGVAGTLGEPFDLRRANTRCHCCVVRFPRQHDWAAGTPPGSVAARSCKSASCNRSAV